MCMCIHDEKGDRYLGKEVAVHERLQLEMPAMIRSLFSVYGEGQLFSGGGHFLPHLDLQMYWEASVRAGDVAAIF